MRCHEVRQLFFLYLDSELDHRAVQEVNLHLESCPECRERWSREVLVEEAVGRTARRIAGPADDFPWGRLEERIGGAGAKKPRPGRVAALMAILGLAVLGLALIGVAAWAFLRSPPALEVAVRSAIEHHEKYLAGGSPLQVPSADAAEVRRFYAGRLGFEVSVPSTASTASTGDGGSGERPTGDVRLLGARRCTFLGGPVVYATYRVESEDVTVIVGPRNPPEDLLEAISEAPTGCVEETVGPYRCLLSEVHGLLFVGTGAVSRERLCDLLVAFREASIPAEDGPADGMATGETGGEKPPGDMR